MASVISRVTRVAADTSGGTQDITISGFGTPKAAIFVLTDAVTDDTEDADFGLSYGATDGTFQGVVHARAIDNTTAPASARRAAADEVCLVITAAGAIEAEANFDSFITNGVRINWGVTPPRAYLLTVVLFGGDDLSAAVRAPAVTTTTSTITVGFESDIVFAFGHGQGFNDTTYTSSEIGLGFAVNDGSDTNMGFLHRSRYSAVTANDREEYVASQTYSYRNFNSTIAATHDGEVTIDNFTSTGFDIVTASATADVGLLALGFGGKASAAAVRQTGPTGTGALTVDPGFRPQFGLAFVNRVPASQDDNATSVTNEQAGQYSIATFDEDGAEYANQLRADDGANPTDVGTISSDAAISIDNQNGVTQYRGTLTSMSRSGFEFDMTSVSGARGGWIFAAIESMSRSLVGSVAGTSTAAAVAVVTAAIAGTADGTSTTTATPSALVALSGTSSGVSVTTATPSARVSLSGAAAGSSATSVFIGSPTPAFPTPIDPRTVRCSSTASATISQRNHIDPVTVEGTSTAVARFVGSFGISGTVDGTSTTTATLNGKTALVGTADGTSTTTATLVATGRLVPFVTDGTSTATCALSAVAQVAGTADGTSTATAALAATYPIDGAAAGTATATATALRRVKVATDPAAGTSTTAATLGGLGTLVPATVAGTSTAVAEFAVTATIVGAAEGTSTATARINGQDTPGLFEAVHNALRTKFATFASTNALNVMYPNAPFDKTDDASFVEFTIDRCIGSAVGTSDGAAVANLTFRHEGDVFARVYVPLGEGDSAALTVAKLLQDEYRNSSQPNIAYNGTETSSIVYPGSPAVTRLGQVGAWHALDVRIPYRIDAKQQRKAHTVGTVNGPADTASALRQLVHTIATGQGLNVQHDNAPYDKPANSVWIVATVLFGEDAIASRASAKVYRTSGLLKVSTFSPWGTGDQVALGFCDTLGDDLRGRRISGVTLQTPSVVTLGADGSWWRVDLDAPFTTDDID